jgi:plasmid stabilization system protein ParE
MQVEWLRAALGNLDDEAAYIAEANPKAAYEFVQAI